MVLYYFILDDVIRDHIVILHGQTREDYIIFVVFCHKTCATVDMYVDIDSGDPDFYGLESSSPTITNDECTACVSFCYSRNGERQSESCTISTTERMFFVMVYAYANYGSGSIYFSDKIAGVEQHGKY